jgi:hypothetical protein
MLSRSFFDLASDNQPILKVEAAKGDVRDKIACRFMESFDGEIAICRGHFIDSVEGFQKSMELRPLNKEELIALYKELGDVLLGRGETGCRILE